MFSVKAPSRMFLFENGYFFLDWPFIHMYPVKTVIKNASFQMHSPEERFLKMPFFVLVWMDDHLVGSKTKSTRQIDALPTLTSFKHNMFNFL